MCVSQPPWPGFQARLPLGPGPLVVATSALIAWVSALGVVSDPLDLAAHILGMLLDAMLVMPA